MLLHVLAEAVNTVADWPQYSAVADDDPVARVIGYRVGPYRWRVPIRDVRDTLPELQRKRDELKVMARRFPLPLRPYPLDQRAREVHARCTLLTAAAYITTSEMRVETARWITFLGRLRADPSGALFGWD
jgi:hypothetical protein